MINPKIRCIVAHKADQHLSRAAEMIPAMGDERFVDFMAVLGNLLSYCAEESQNGVSPDSPAKTTMTFRNLGFLIIFAQVGVEQAALSALAKAEEEEAEGNVE